MWPRPNVGPRRSGGFPTPMVLRSSGSLSSLSYDLLSLFLCAGGPFFFSGRGGSVLFQVWQAWPRCVLMFSPWLEANWPLYNCNVTTVGQEPAAKHDDRDPATTTSAKGHSRPGQANLGNEGPAGHRHASLTGPRLPCWLSFAFAAVAFWAGLAQVPG